MRHMNLKFLLIKVLMNIDIENKDFDKMPLLISQ